MNLKAISLALYCLVTNPVLAEENFNRLEDFVSQAKLDIGLPTGTGIAVIKDGKIIYEGYFGYANIESKRPVSSDTAFYIASVTKPFFALASLLKEHRGELREDDTLIQLFPDLDFAQIDASKITVKHLLSHTTGIDNLPMETATAFTGLHDNHRRNFLIANSVPHQHKKLNEYAYANLGYNILSVWFENHDQQEWQKTLQQTVFEPLALRRTSSYISVAKEKRWPLNSPYSFLKQDKLEPVYLQKQNNMMQAAGGMLASVNDLGRFLIAQLNQGRVDGQQVFPAEVILKSHQKVARLEAKYESFDRSGYAWGWYLGPYKDQLMYHHFGGFAGDHSHLSFIPAQGIGLVVLNNEDIMSSRLTDAIADIVYSQLLGKVDLDQLINTRQTNLKKYAAGTDRYMIGVWAERADRVMQLSLEKLAYTGHYEHPLHGVMEIQLNRDDRLEVSWGNLRNVPTASTKPDHLRAELIPGQGRNIKLIIEDKQVVAFQFDGGLFRKQPISAQNSPAGRCQLVVCRQPALIQNLDSLSIRRSSSSTPSIAP